jgi:hypothetical protein
VTSSRRTFFLSAANHSCPGTNNCSDTDPNLLTVLGLQGSDVPEFDGGQYEQGLMTLQSTYQCTNRISSHFIGTRDPDALLTKQRVLRNELCAPTHDTGDQPKREPNDLSHAAFGSLALLGPHL